MFLNYKFEIMNFRKLLLSVYAHGGGSYNPNYGTTNPDSGYMVSLPKFERIVEMREDQLEAAIKEVSGLGYDYLIKPNYFLGVWEDCGKYYVDISENIDDLKSAVKAGMRRSQLAIFDCKKGSVISIPSMQTAGTYTQQNTFINLEAQRIAHEQGN